MQGKAALTTENNKIQTSDSDADRPGTPTVFTLMHPLKLSGSFGESCVVLIILSSKFRSDFPIIWIFNVQLWTCQNATQLTENWGTCRWQMCLLPHWRERSHHSWFACRALCNKLKLGSTRIVFYQTELATHYTESVSSVEWTDLNALIQTTMRGVELLNWIFLLKMTPGCATVEKNVKDEAHLGCAEHLMKRSAVTFRALCSWDASYSMGGVIKATIRLSNRPPSSDFSALTKSWWFMIKKTILIWFGMTFALFIWIYSKHICNISLYAMNCIFKRPE